MRIRIKRVYEAASNEDGVRILVDGLWPRGLKKEAARVDVWLREVAPSAGLRRWFGHEPSRWSEFRRRYFAELREREAAVRQIRDVAERETVTLLFAAKDEACNNAAALRDFLLTRT